jgi:hypothetical protein
MPTGAPNGLYGVTCAECGQVLEGYGYGGFIGKNLNGKERCVHAAWYQVGGGGKAQCPYCKEILSGNASAI